MPDPKILNQRDAIVKITSTAICGSDLHLYNGFMPTMKKGDILGHEFMGEVVEVGRASSRTLKVGDRVVVPFTIACGNCCACRHETVSLLRELQPQRRARREADGARRLGRLRLLAPDRRLRRRPGRVRPRAVRRRRPAQDRERPRPTSRCCSSPTSCPTGYMGAEMCDIQPGDIDRGVGLRPGRPVRDQERVPARRRAGHRDRPLPLPARDGARRSAAPRRSTTSRSTAWSRRSGDDRRAAARTPASTRSALEAHGHGARRHLYDRASRPWPRDRPADRRCARRSWPAATAARCRSSASMAA